MDESGGPATATTSDLDGWIEQLYECKQLSETQVKGMNNHFYDLKIHKLRRFV